MIDKTLPETIFISSLETHTYRYMIKCISTLSLTISFTVSRYHFLFIIDRKKNIG